MGLFDRLFNWIMSLFWKKEMSITILGLSNAGKSTLVKALMGDTNQDTTPTIGVETNTFSRGGVQITAWDIGGHRQFQFLWPTYCQNARAILYILDSADKDAIEESRTQLHNLANGESSGTAPILICGNKNDLPEALNDEQLIQALDLSSIEGHEIAFFSISATKHTNLYNVVDWLVKHA